MLWNFTPESIRKEIEKAVGKPDNHFGSFYPQTLPNLKRTTESKFWGYHSSYSFASDSIYLGHMKLDGDEGTVRLFYVNSGMRAGGGFAVLTAYSYPDHKVSYFEWTSCEHTFKRENIGNCLNRYTCTKCGSEHDVDSSD